VYNFSVHDVAHVSCLEFMFINWCISMAHNKTPINHIVVVHPALTEDGTSVLDCSGDRFVFEMLGGSLEGLTQESRGIIEKYDLNSELEIRFRVNKKEIDSLSDTFGKVRGLPFRFFINALTQAQILNRNSWKHSQTSDNLLRSMLYSNVISALESLFSDFLISSVVENREYLSNLGSNWEVFNQTKYSLKDLIRSDAKPIDLAVNKLHGIVFHNLNKTKEVYSSAFGIDFPDCSGLAVAVLNRHDIVHRNGCKKGRDVPEKYSQKMVVSLIVEVQEFVLSLLSQLNKIEESK